MNGAAIERGTLHVLLVDDDPLVVKVYAERMRHEGWRVAIARDGWEACQEVRRTRFDIILLDIRMPFHSGVEVVREVREGIPNRETPLYILTSMSEGEDVQDSLRLGANGVFYKSSTRPEELVLAVYELIDGNPDVAQEAEDFFSAPVDDEIGESGVLPGAASTAPGGVTPHLDREFDVYVNPLLGDGARLARAFGLRGFQCPECGGQICLRLGGNPHGRERDVAGYLLCSDCGREV